MKLRKQAPAKAFIVAASAGLLFAFWGLVKSNTHLQAQSASPPVDYQRFFAPASGAPSLPASIPPPHTRTHAS